MDISIKQSQPLRYTNQIINKNDKQKEIFNLNVDDKKISEEEDNKLYELYEETAWVLNGTFEEFKKQLICFPPVTAPGIVRKVWREKLENATPEEDKNMLSFTCCYSNFLERNNKYKENMPKDLNGYLNFINDMKKYIEQYNIPAVDKKLYEGIKNVANAFELELKKY